MKKGVVIFMFLFCNLLLASAQHSESEYMTFLNKREFSVSFGWESYVSLIFTDEGTYSIGNRDVGSSEGNYHINGNKVYLDTPYSPLVSKKDEYTVFSVFNMQCDKENVFTIDLDKTDFWNIGAIIKDGKIFISDLDAPPYRVYLYKGIKCYKYPCGRNSQLPEKIRINENLKMRKTPSLKGEVEHVSRRDNEGNIIDTIVVFSGEEYELLAKTTFEEEIDGIKAPWYLIDVYGTNVDIDDPDRHEVWIYGGYVTK